MSSYAHCLVLCFIMGDKRAIDNSKEKSQKTKKPTKLIKFGEKIVKGTFSGELRRMYNVV